MKLHAAGMIEPNIDACTSGLGCPRAALDARDHVHRHLVQVRREMVDRVDDAQQLALAGRPAAALEVLDARPRARARQRGSLRRRR